MTDNGDSTYTYTDEDGTATTFTGTDDQIANEVNITDAGGNFTSTEVEGALAELAAQTDDDVSVTNTIAGNRIATISEPGVAAIDIDETVTVLSQNTTTGEISYTDEDGGAPATAQVVSGDVGNELSVGTDGGAMFSITPTEMDEGGVASPTLENTVQEVIDAIAPITSKAARIFYPPSIAIDASTNGTFSVDLYAQYTAQFGTPTVASTGAPGAVPTYAATELYYYVTYADPDVFGNGVSVLNMSIDGNGVLSYEIFNQPADYNSLINVVFVVK